MKKLFLILPIFLFAVVIFTCTNNTLDTLDDSTDDDETEETEDGDSSDTEETEDGDNTDDGTEDDTDDESSDGENILEPPSTPTGLKVKDETTTSLTITWDSVTAATGYKLYNSLNSNGPYYLLYEGTLTEIVNNSLPSNTTVYYKVSAYNDNGESSLSAYSFGTTLSIPGDPVYFGGLIYAADGQFLGVINDNEFDSNSIANSFGTYGSVYSSYSIWNEFGTYGSEFSSYSPYNAFTTTPPEIYVNGNFYAYLTVGIKLPQINPNNLAVEIGRFDVVR